jgi:fructose-bisphosphate aldolase class II
MLVTNGQILLKAKAKHYAVGAFNINNMEIVQGIVMAAEEMKSPAIIATSEGAIKYAGYRYISKILQAAAETTSVPISLHLDHGKDIEVVRKCIEEGWTSVMIDASSMTYEKNIEITNKVIDLAKPHGVSVEAELGTLKGIEDNVSADVSHLTDPGQAVEFVRLCPVDALAIAIGTSHGAYKFKGESKLDFDRLKEIVKKISIPIVLHGASGVDPKTLEKFRKYGGQIGDAKGVSDDAIKKAAKLGVCKINIDTDNRLAFSAALRETIANKKDEFDPRNLLGPSREAVKEVCRYKMKLFGSAGKA